MQYSSGFTVPTGDGVRGCTLGGGGACTGDMLVHCTEGSASSGEGGARSSTGVSTHRAGRELALQGIFLSSCGELGGVGSATTPDWEGSGLTRQVEGGGGGVCWVVADWLLCVSVRSSRHERGFSLQRERSSIKSGFNPSIRPPAGPRDPPLGHVTPPAGPRDHQGQFPQYVTQQDGSMWGLFCSSLKVALCCQTSAGLTNHI